MGIIEIGCNGGGAILSFVFTPHDMHKIIPDMLLLFMFSGDQEHNSNLLNLLFILFVGWHQSSNVINDFNTTANEHNGMKGLT